MEKKACSLKNIKENLKILLKKFMKTSNHPFNFEKINSDQAIGLSNTFFSYKN